MACLCRSKRPPIPAPADLPGPHSGAWVGLERYTALMQRCWAEEPGQRPGFGEMVRELQALVG